MGNAAIWWEPTGASIVRKIDLGARLSDLQVLLRREERLARAGGGARGSSRIHSYRQVSIVSAPFTDYTLLDEIEAMTERLRGGGRISLTEDTASVYAAYADPWLSDDTMGLIRSPWHLYGGALAELDRLAVSGPSPKLLTETTMCTAVPLADVSSLGGTIDVSVKRNDWSAEEYVFVRNPAFWPVLHLPVEATYRDAQFLIHKHRRYFRLEMTLDEDVDGIATLALTPDVSLQGTTDTGKPVMSEQIELIKGS